MSIGGAGALDVAAEVHYDDLFSVLIKEKKSYGVAYSLPSFCGMLIRLLMLGRFWSDPVCAGLGLGWAPNGASCWTAGGFICGPPPAEAGIS